MGLFLSVLHSVISKTDRQAGRQADRQTDRQPDCARMLSVAFDLQCLFFLANLTPFQKTDHLRTGTLANTVKTATILLGVLGSWRFCQTHCLRVSCRRTLSPRSCWHLRSTRCLIVLCSDLTKQMNTTLETYSNPISAFSQAKSKKEDCLSAILLLLNSTAKV